VCVCVKERERERERERDVNVCTDKTKLRGLRPRTNYTDQATLLVGEVCVLAVPATQQHFS
jgi:hypothetical protein